MKLTSRWLLGFAAALAIQWTPAMRQAFGASPTNAPPKLTVQETPLNRDSLVGASFAPVIKRVGPSVVNIYSSMTIRERPMTNPFLGDPLLRRFFGEDPGEQGRPRERTAQSLGSGVIVSQDGYILTANHVVEGADKVKVALASGSKEFDAQVIGADPPTDIAVLKIDAQNLPAAAIADSDKLEVGDLVLALGNPFGLGQTVTMGIVSAVGRGGYGINAYENFIQTDAAINVGNSGGALVDGQGRLVGINTAIFSRSGGNMGVGFAVPISMARYVMDRITTEGKVTRGYLGINIQPLTPELAQEFKLPDESSGVLVGGVVPDGAAAKAGIRDGDVILQFNGKKVTDPRNLQLFVAQSPPGERIPLRILRTEKGKAVERTVTATLAELPQERLLSQQRGRSRQNSEPSTRDALDGVEVTDLDPQVRRQFDMPNNLQGALVTNVEEDSKSAEAGLRPGDVIVEMNREPVRNAEDAVDLSQKAQGNRVLLRVWAQADSGVGGTRYIVVNNAKGN